MAAVTITMTVNTDTITPDNLGTAITHSVSGGALNKVDPGNSQLDEIIVYTNDSITIQMVPKNNNARIICNVSELGAKFNGGNVNTFFGNVVAAGTDGRKTLAISSVNGGPGSSLNYVLTLNVNGTTYLFDPKIKVNIVHP